MIRRADVPVVHDVETRIVLGSFPVGSIGGLHDAVRAARTGNLAAVTDVLRRVRVAMPSVWPEVTAAVVVPVPGHLPGPPHPLLVAVCEAIAAVRGWHLATEALRRRTAAPEAKAGRTGDPGGEAATLGWRHPTPGEVIVLVDDVVRTGATIRSCAEAVRLAGDERRVVAIALARADQRR